MNIKKIPSKNWELINFPVGNLSKESKQPITLQNAEAQKISMKFINESIFKCFLTADSNKNNLYEDFSWTISEELTKSSVTEWSNNNNILELKPDGTEKSEHKIVFDPTVGHISYLKNDEKVFRSTIRINKKKKWLTVDFVFDDDQFKCFGLGEHTNPMDKKGAKEKFYFWNSDMPGYNMGENPLYQSWPILIVYYNNLFFAIIVDNPSFSAFDLKKENKIDYFIFDTEINLYFLFGPTLRKIMEQINLLTGKSLPIPKWALGYQQCRWSYTPSSRVREIADIFREKEIPCDVIYLDIDYMDRFKCFTFGSAFNDYKELIEELHSKGFKVIPIIDPGIKIEPGYHVYDEGITGEFFIKDKNNQLITIKVWPGECHFPDFLNTKVRVWWSNLVKKFIEETKIDGIWCDMNEPSTFDPRRTLHPDAQQHFDEKGVFINHSKVHNLFGYLMAKATFDGLRKTTPNPYVLTRSSYLGGQKYSVAWTGDNCSTWSHLQTSIPMILSLGLSGQPVVGPDIGGFVGNPSDKLYERWILQGAFFPFSRSHTVEHSPDQEPWSFGEEVEEKARKVISLRYKIIPYYYSLLYEAYIKGYPIIRPLFFDSTNEALLDPTYYESEFFIGKFLLLTPFNSKSTKRQIYLPPGYWYSFWNKEDIFEGDKIITIEENDHESIPLFFSNEAIIPMYTNNLQFIPQESQEDLSLMLVIKDSTQKNTFDFIEYFDPNCVLGLKITLAKEETIIVLTIEEIRNGSVPDKYFLPKKLHLQINYFVRTLKDVDKNTYEINTDKDDWSEIVLHEPVYPMSLFIETLF